MTIKDSEQRFFREEKKLYEVEDNDKDDDEILTQVKMSHTLKKNDNRRL